MTETTENSGGYDGKGLRGALWTLAGTTIGQLATNSGILGGVLGRPPFPPDGPGAPVSREILDLKTENSMLKANAHADQMNAQQAVVNAVQQGRIDCLQRQVDQLFGLTQLTVPNANLNPGYGPATVGPAPSGAAVAPDVTAIASAVASAVAAAMKDAA